MRLPSADIMSSEHSLMKLTSAFEETDETRQHEQSHSQDDQVLSFTPQQAHIFGGQSIFLSFNKSEQPLNEQWFYYVVFKGSKLRHITSAKILNPYTLQAVIPDHDQAELVSLSIYQYGDNIEETIEDNKILVTETFTFTSDSSQFLAQQLISNASHASGLKQLSKVYSTLLDVSTADKHVLDSKLTTSFRNMSRATAWSLVSDQHQEHNEADDDDGWNLLHFCAKYSLCQLAEYLLTRTDAKRALEGIDEHGRTPVDVATQNDHKKLVEVLSRIPCEEDVHQSTNEALKRANVKRHSLGTTTITNTINGDHQDDFDKDLMILKEVHTLAADSHRTAKLNGNHAQLKDDEHSPLSESLKKLQEINDEIRRLRSLSYRDNIEQYEREMNGEVATNFVEDGLKVDDDEEDFLDIGLNEANNNIVVEKNATVATTDGGDDVVQNDENAGDNSQESVVAVDSGIDSVVVERSKEENEDTTALQDNTVENPNAAISRQDDTDESVPSNGSVAIVKIEEYKPVQALEIVPSIEEVTPQVTEVMLASSSSLSEDAMADVTCAPVHSDTEGDELEEEDGAEQANDDEVDQNCLIPGDMNFKLESVTEETEEELKADGSGRSPTVLRRPKLEGSSAITQAKSLTELPPHPPKRVGILKRQGAKKDRPLSDSFENLQMVANQGIIDLFKGTTSQGGDSTLKTPSLTRGHSLDALMTDVNGSEGDIVPSEPSSRTSLPVAVSSVNHQQGSQDSLTSDGDSPKSRSRSGSEKMSVSSQRGASSLSLNEALISRCSSMSSQEDLTKPPSKKGSSLFRVFSVKKAKSLSSLDMSNDKNNLISEEDRRKTIIGDLNVDLIGDKSGAVSSERSDVVTHQDMYGDILVRCVSYDSDVKKSQSTVSLDTVGKDGEKETESLHHRRISTSALPHSYGRRFTNSDGEDTDEGTSTDIAEKQERKTVNAEEKAKRRFGILRKPKDKDKKSVKDKDKEKREYRERKDSESRMKKKPPVPNQKPDSTKSSFLTKRGSSFRQNFNWTPDLKVSEKPMFTRVASTGNNNGNKLRSSDRKSPSVSRKFSNVLNDGNHDGDSHNLLHSKNLSSSRTSIDSLGFPLDADDTDYSPYTNNSLEEQEYDSDLDADDVPETWSEQVDKKVQRKMHAKDIKRQDVIYELIETEAQYVRILHVMKKIYLTEMVNLNIDERTIEAIFPEIDEIIDLNGGFYKDMKKRQDQSVNLCIENIGDILLGFFGGEKGERLKLAYGIFCSKHLEAVAKHKELLKTDKKFAAHMKKCLLNERSRRLSVPECITYITIRMTKYPLLIEAIIKATKEAKPDYENLKKSLYLVKECLEAVNEAVEEKEQRKELEALKKILDKKNVVEIKVGQTKAVYRANKLFHKRSKLLRDKKTFLRGKSKLHETRMVVLAEKIIFFQDNGGKLQLLPVDNKAPVLSLKNLMVREVATDNKALFLVSTSKDAAQIYEIVCDSYKDKKEFMNKLKTYIKHCPDEEEAITDNEEEAKQLEEERMAKLREIIDQLQGVGDNLNKAFADKNRLVSEMRELIEYMDDAGPVKGSSCSDLKPTDVLSARETLEACINEVNTLSTSIPPTPQTSDGPLSSPSPLSSSGSISTTSLPNSKRNDNTHDLRNVRPPYSSNNIPRTMSMKPGLNKSSGVSETDAGPNKPRRQSQMIFSLGRTKATGSTEDLTSLSSSSSINSISSAMSQMQIYQNLRENLSNLVDVTNKQDIEIAKMRLELQESRNEITKLRTDKKDLEDKVCVQQKEFDRNLRNENERYQKLTREFKRTTEKMSRQYEEKKAHYNQVLDALNAERQGRQNSDETVYL